MKHTHFLPVFLTLIASYLGLHFYAARWLIKNFALPPGAAAWLRGAFLLAAFFAPFTMYLKRQWHAPLLEPLYTAGHAWMGIILLTAFIFACFDLAALALRQRPELPRFFLARTAMATLFLILAWAFYGDLKAPSLKNISIAIKGLPPGLEGYKIAQISDLHLDSDWKLRRFAATALQISSAAPDLVLFTGDVIDPGVSCRQNAGQTPLKIKSRQGVFGALGNHEYYYGRAKALDCLKDLGITPLANEAVELKDLRLIGMGDIRTENMSPSQVKALLEKHKSAKFTIVMSHQPLHYRLMAETGDYLVLSGHTHSGQIFPFHIFTKLFYGYFYGLHRIGKSFFYITSGAGTWGPPMRWLAPSEIPIITLMAD